MKETAIKVLKIAPGVHPEVVTLRNDLTSLQDALSIGAEYRGLIEIINLDPDTCLIANEEGKLIGLTPNRRIGKDILCGVFYIAGQDKRGNLTSITDSALQRYSALFHNIEKIPAEEVGHTVFMTFRTY